MKGGSNILVLVISLAFVAMGMFILAKADTDADRLTAATTLLFFGGCVLVGIAQMLSEAPPPYDLASGYVLLVPARIHPLLMGIASAMWSAAGLAGMVSHIFPTLLSWALFLFGALGAIVWLPLALNFLAKVEIDRNGFWDHRLTHKPILWSDVAFILPGSPGYGRSRIEVTLKSPAAHAARRRLLFWRVNLQPAAIRPFMPTQSVFWIADAIQHLAPPELLPPPIFYDDQDLDEEWDDDDWETGDQPGNRP